MSKTFFTRFISLRDFYNISITIIFSINVGLAWCGYVVSTRWIKSNNISVEPTISGWFVAISCYPPFQKFLGLYFTVPNERGLLSISNPYIAAFFVVLAVASYFIYMAATIHFGIRFPNLTHRGIIRNGLYSKIRHPAYAVKNFAWCFIMMPYVIYQAIVFKNSFILLQIFGLLIMTTIYYFRAVTEEKHLSMDPEYLDYCKEVPYHFIPGVI